MVCISVVDSIYMQQMYAHRLYQPQDLVEGHEFAVRCSRKPGVGCAGQPGDAPAAQFCVPSSTGPGARPGAPVPASHSPWPAARHGMA